MRSDFDIFGGNRGMRQAGNNIEQRTIMQHDHALFRAQPLRRIFNAVGIIELGFRKRALG